MLKKDVVEMGRCLLNDYEAGLIGSKSSAVQSTLHRSTDLTQTSAALQIKRDQKSTQTYVKFIVRES